MNFPTDHYWHPRQYNGEWCYFWGRLNNGKFFHFSEFHLKFGGTESETIHYSLDGKFKDEIVSWDEDIFSTSGYTNKRFSFQTPEMGLTFIQDMKPVVHKTGIEGKNYYSIPFLSGEGHLNGKEVAATGWFDHEFSNFHKIENWDWIGIQLDNQIYIMAAKQGERKFCDLAVGDRVISSDFSLEGNILNITNLGMTFLLEPLEKEIVFDPRFGIKYSEQPLNVVNNGKVIGYAMRERTYKEKEDAWT